MKFYLSLMLAAIMMMSVYAFSATETHVEKQILIDDEETPVLGVMVENASSETLEKYKLDGGAEIVKVLEGSEAEKIGLKKDDIIVKFSGKNVEDVHGLRDLVSKTDKDKSVDIVVYRDGQKKDFQAKLTPMKPGEYKMKFFSGDSDSNFAFAWHPAGMRAPKHIFLNKLGCDGGKGGYLGVEVQDLNEQLMKYFDVKNGVLVEKVVKDSPAEKAGLQAGDILIEINGKKIEDYGDLVRILNYYDPETKVDIKYSRKGKVSQANVVLGKKEHNSKWLNLNNNMENLDIRLDDLNDEIKIQTDKIRVMGENIKKMEFTKELYIF